MEADFEHLTDVFGSMQFIRRYSLISLVFRYDDSATADSVTPALEEALARLTNAAPYLAGKVIYEGRDDTHTGIRKIVPHQGVIPLLGKDLSQGSQMPSLDEMVMAGVPMSMLDADLLVPSIALTWHNDGFDKLAPVLILQANYIRGGLILTICSNHTTMDMTGLGMVISLFAKSCRNEPFTDEEIQEANQDRRNVVPLLGSDYTPGRELDESFINPDAASFSVPTSHWVYFSFSPSALTNLKSAASQQSIVPYITTDDAISALVWQRMTAVRTLLHPDTFPPTSQVARTVSARSYFGLKGYIGHMVDCVYCKLPSLPTMPLGEVAGHLRANVADKDAIIYHTRAYLTALDRLDDKTKIISGAQLNPNHDAVMSSYANLKSCELDFGALLGKPLAGRRPRLPGWPSLCYIMPRDASGEMAVAVCLPDDEMEALRRDQVFGRYARWLG